MIKFESKSKSKEKPDLRCMGCNRLMVCGSKPYGMLLAGMYVVAKDGSIVEYEVTKDLPKVIGTWHYNCALKALKYVDEVVAIK